MIIDKSNLYKLFVKGVKKISEYLISISMALAIGVKQKIGLRWLALNPDNGELEKFYIDSFKFVKYKTTKDKLVYLFIALS